MRSKPADLSASLVAIKGTAAPSPDMPGRAGGSTIAAVPPAAAPSTVAPASGEAKPARPPRRATAAPEAPKEANLTPLNFRIPASFRREFRTYAATHDLKLNELLRLCFEAFRKLQRD